MDRKNELVINIGILITKNAAGRKRRSKMDRIMDLIMKLCLVVATCCLTVFLVFCIIKMMHIK